MDLPPPREPGVYRVALVCLGNICRSPMAHVVLEDRVAAAGLDEQVHVRSAGTGGWHVGEPMDRRAAATLREAGLDPSRHRGQQFEAGWFSVCDLVLAMDASNLADLEDLLPAATGDATQEPLRLRLFRDLDPLAGSGDGDRDVPDPYYGADDGFATVLAMVERTCDALVTALVELLDDAPGSARSSA